MIPTIATAVTAPESTEQQLIDVLALEFFRGGGFATHEDLRAVSGQFPSDLKALGYVRNATRWAMNRYAPAGPVLDGYNALRESHGATQRAIDALPGVLVVGAPPADPLEDLANRIAWSCSPDLGPELNAQRILEVLRANRQHLTA